MLVPKGAIGGMQFGEGNSIYYSDQSPNTHLLQRVTPSDSHYKFFERASVADLNLIPHGAGVTNYAPARIAQPLNCSAVAKELGRHQDHDDDPSGFSPPGNSVSSFVSTPTNMARARISSQKQTNSTGYVTKRQCVINTTKMLFGIFSQNPVFKLFSRDGSSNNITAQKDDDKSDSELGLELKLKPDPVNSLQTPADILNLLNLKSETPVTLNLKKTGSAADVKVQSGYLNSPEAAPDSSAIRQQSAVLPEAAPVRFTARLTGPESGARTEPYKRATSNLLAHKFKVVFSMLAVSLIMSNQPVANATVANASLEEQRDQMDKFLGDVLDKQIENYSQCSDCLKRSRACQDCRFHNSQRSLREMQDTALIWKNMKVIQDPNFPNVKSRKVMP